MGQSKVTVKGTGQLNGPVVINKTVEMDTSMANKFTGSNRYEVIEGFLNTNYPGVKCNPKNFGVNVVSIKNSDDKSSSSNSKNSSTTGKSAFSKAGNIAVGTASAIGAVGGFLFNSKEEDEEEDEEENNFNLKKEKERLDFEYYKKQKEIDFINQKNNLKKAEKNEKRKVIREDMDNGGSKFFGYFRIFWTYLDKWWKKAIFFYIVLLIISEIAITLGFDK